MQDRFYHLAFAALIGAAAVLIGSQVMESSNEQGPLVMRFPDPGSVVMTPAAPQDDIYLEGEIEVLVSGCVPQLDRTHAYVIDGTGWGRRVNQWSGVRMESIAGKRRTIVKVEAPRHSAAGAGFVGFEITYRCGDAPLRRHLSPPYPVEILPAG